MPFSSDTLEQMLGGALAAVGEAQAKEPVHYFSSAGDPCQRALAYDLIAGSGARPPRELKHALSMLVGTSVGGLIELGCERLGWKTQEKVTLRNGSDLEVSGSLDVHGPGFVLDLKLVGENSWKRIQHAPNDKHVHQVNGYAVGAKEPEWVLAYLRAISIFRPGELEWRIFRGVSDSVRAAKIVQTWEEVYAHKAAGTLPSRPATFAKDRFPCGWCHHQTQCWG